MKLKPYRLHLFLALICALASGAILPASSRADPYSRNYAPSTGPFPANIGSQDETPDELLRKGDQALNAGAPHRFADNVDLAMHYYDRALNAATLAANRAAASDAALRLARLCFEPRGTSRSVTVNRRITRYFEAAGAKEVVLKLKIRLGELLRVRGDLVLAEDQYDQTLNNGGLGGREPELARDYTELAGAFFAAGDFERALRLKHKGERLDVDAPALPDSAAHIAALDKQALEAAARSIASKEQADHDRMLSSVRPAGVGAAGPVTGGLGAPAGARANGSALNPNDYTELCKLMFGQRDAARDTAEWRSLCGQP